MSGHLARSASIAFVILGTLVAQAQAQGFRQGAVNISPELGVRFSRDFSIDKWGVGGHLRIPLLRTLDLRPSGDIDLGVGGIGKDYQLNGDIALRGARDLAYLGGGIAYVHRQFGPGNNDGVGPNLFVGFKPLPRPGAQLYLEGRWTKVEGESIVRVSMGVAFRF